MFFFGFWKNGKQDGYGIVIKNKKINYVKYKEGKKIKKYDYDAFSGKITRVINKKHEKIFFSDLETLKKKKIHCNPCWPTCLYDNYNHIVVEYVIMKENKAPFLINDYYYIKNQGNENGNFDNIYELGNSSNKDILIERHKHVCDDMKLVNTSQNLIENLTKRNNNLNIDGIFEENKNNEDTKIYGHLGESKDFDNLIQEIKKIIIKLKR